MIREESGFLEAAGQVHIFAMSEKGRDSLGRDIDSFPSLSTNWVS